MKEGTPRCTSCWLKHGLGSCGLLVPVVFVHWHPEGKIFSQEALFGDKGVCVGLVRLSMGF